MADKAKKAAEAIEKDAEKSVKAEETPDVTSDASEAQSEKAGAPEKEGASKKGSPAKKTASAKKKTSPAKGDSDKKNESKSGSGKSTSEKTRSKKAASKDSDKKSSGKAAKSSERRKSDKSGKNDEAATQLHAPGANRWVVPTFVTLALLGVLWMVVFYISSTANIDIPVMSDIGYWNLAIGMGLLAVSLGLTTQWK